MGCHIEHPQSSKVYLQEGILYRAKVHLHDNKYLSFDVIQERFSL